MAGVFQNIDRPPPSPPGECVPPFERGMTHSLGGERGGGLIFWKTSDTALYSTYVSTLCLESLKHALAEMIKRRGTAGFHQAWQQQAGRRLRLSDWISDSVANFEIHIIFAFNTSYGSSTFSLIATML
jgi:hypothetical protein